MATESLFVKKKKKKKKNSCLVGVQSILTWHLVTLKKLARVPVSANVGEEVPKEDWA